MSHTSDSVGRLVFTVSCAIIVLVVMMAGGIIATVLSILVKIDAIDAIDGGDGRMQDD